MTNTLDGKRDFFISFNNADRRWATWIAWVLEEKGYSVFFQDWDFKGNFVLEMDKVHQQSRRTLAVVSPNYFASSFTAPEWAARFKEEATNQYDLLIPVRVRECEPPSLLGSIVHVDLVGLPRDQARSRLLERIAGIRLKPNEGPFHPGGLLPAAARSIPSEPNFPGGKAIVVLSDGTGNSAAKLFKTNVWRLYQALDLAEPTPAAQGAARQIAYYDDGVGTSSFRPLALLGGVFGWGLKRNVLDLYAFICRNYEPGDRIYAFGFSRGAFTIRILVNLIAKHGVLHCPTERELAAYARDTYRAYRYCFNQTGRHVHLLRKLRDKIIAAWRSRQGMQPLAAVPRIEVNKIAFVGVWDTVGAYGMPIDELTRGIDKWVWPLSMPSYVLSAKVKVARHALALDDERDTFHPLLWDEVAEQKLIEEGKVDSNRMQQVWFAGMHSDVGGGYPDDALAYVPLDWMMREAAATGLCFKQRVVVEVRRARNEFGPMHDSRHGLAGYYRYQPRKISAMMHSPDPTCLIMRDPDPNGRGRLTSVKVHESVLKRIMEGPDRYAPIVLPERHEVVQQDGSIVGSSEVETPKWAMRQEWVWDDVWRRRVTYFTTVGVSLAVALLPLVQQAFPPSACVGPQCLLTPVITGIGSFLPGFAQPWIEAFGLWPGLFAGLVAAIALLLLQSGGLQQRIKDGMGELWRVSSRQAAPDTAERSKSWVYLLRTNRFYQKVFQLLKWKIVPTVFGLLLLVGGALLALALLVAVVTRFVVR
jgi:uncharacterized protein (DUF2235 family)